MEKLELETWIKTNLEISFARSKGPGGQNINKLSTKTVARLPLNKMDILSDDEKERLRSNLKNRINKRDEIVVHVQEERTQIQNREIALKRITALVLKALEKQKQRIETKPSPSSKQKRVKEKKMVGEKKLLRRKIDFDE